MVAMAMVLRPRDTGILRNSRVCSFRSPCNTVKPLCYACNKACSIKIQQKGGINSVIQHPSFQLMGIPEFRSMANDLEIYRRSKVSEFGGPPKV